MTCMSVVVLIKFVSMYVRMPVGFSPTSSHPSSPSCLGLALVDSSLLRHGCALLVPNPPFPSPPQRGTASQVVRRPRRRRVPSCFFSPFGLDGRAFPRGFSCQEAAHLGHLSGVGESVDSVRGVALPRPRWEMEMGRSGSEARG